MSYRRTPGWVVSILCLVLATSVAHAKPKPEEVDAAIKRGIAFLYSKQDPNTGSWEMVPAAVLTKPHHDPSGWQWGGLTGVSLSALLTAGESNQDARIKKGIDWLKTADVFGLYAIGFRAQVWQYVPNHPGVKSAATKDKQYLLKSIYQNVKEKSAGFYPYALDPKTGKTSPENWYDHSVSQYGVLAMWAMSQSGVEIPSNYWKLVEAGWRAHQLPTGAWGYRFQETRADFNQETVAMTAAGLATLFITQDMIHANESIACNGNPVDSHIAAGMKWMHQNFNQFDKVTIYAPYTLYGAERVGVASGHKYFGDHDWYQAGVEYLLKRQEANGSWGKDDQQINARNIPDTAFAVMFLSRGRAPVIVNKLEYGAAAAAAAGAAKPKVATWNERPRDVANITRWAGKQIERTLNWQITNLRAPIADLHDAPILWISGKEALGFSPEEVAKLRQYVETGGLILGNADCGNKAFADSFKALGKQLFPAYEFRELPAEHAIYQRQQFRRPNWRPAPFLQGLSNGSRELMLLFPTADPAKSFQGHAFTAANAVLAEATSNVFLYANDRASMRTKGESHLIEPDPGVKPEKTIKLARIEYGGNWNPEPGGWSRLAAHLRNTQKVELVVEAVKLGEGKLSAKDHPVAHLTGTAKMGLPPAAQAELKAYVESGGTLIVDACGGAAEFATDAEAMLTSTFGAAALTTASPGHPAFASPKIEAFEYRSAARKTVGDTKLPRLRAVEVEKKARVFLSPDDLSTALVAHPVDGISGYTPKTATAVMTSLILYATSE